MVHLRYRLEDFAAFVIYPQETKTSLDMSISDGKVWDISGFFYTSSLAAATTHSLPHGGVRSHMRMFGRPYDQSIDDSTLSTFSSSATAMRHTVCPEY